MTFSREWAIPSADTFTVRPIHDIFLRWRQTLPQEAVIVDPFARNCRLGTITNDMDTNCATTYHLDALTFLQGLQSGLADMVLLDPPYSYRQVKECYNGIGIEHFDPRQTRSDYWADIDRECARVLKGGGVCIKCGWNTAGLGRKWSMEMKEVLIVNHDGHRNDTLITVEVKEKTMWEEA